MLRSVRLRKGLAALLGVALLGVFITGDALAASGDEILKELQQRVDGLESLVKDLSISVMNASKNLEAQATGLQPRIFNVENMVKDLSFDVKKTVAAMSDMQGHVDALSAQVEEFQPLVINLQSTVVKFGDRLEHFSSSIDKLTVGLANVTAHADEIDARVNVLGEHLGGQIAALSDEFAAMYSVVSQMKANLETSAGQIASLQEATVTLNVKVQSNTESIYENHSAIEDLYGSLEEIYSAVQDDFAGFGDQFHEMQLAIGTLDERTGKLERAVDELSILGPTLASLRNTVAGLAARADRVDARLGRLEDVAEQFSGTAQAFNDVAAMTQALAARLGDAEKMIAELKGQDTDYTYDDSYLVNAIEDLQNQIDRVRAMAGTPTTNGASQAQLDDLKAKIGQLVIELESAKTEIGVLREQVTNTQVTTIDKQQIISEIRTEIRSEIQDLSGAAELAAEAAKKADAANGLALLALLAGVASIALNLLL